MAGLFPDLRGSGACEARPRNLRLTAMLWQGDVLSPLLIFLLHLGELRIECLELIHQAREIVFVASLAATRARALDPLNYTGGFQLRDLPPNLALAHVPAFGQESDRKRVV